MKKLSPQPVLVSVITVVRNDAPALERTLQSVSGQDFRRVEAIVIDGGSHDDTIAVILKNRDWLGHWSSAPDEGPYDAMNKGLSAATGEWVIFMNAGDCFADDGVLTRIFSKELQDYGAVYGDCIADYGPFRILKKARIPGLEKAGMPFSHQSLMVRTSLARKISFNTRFSVAADYDMVLRLLNGGIRFHYHAGPVAIVDTRGISNRRMMASEREHWSIYCTLRKPGLRGMMIHFAGMAWLAAVTFAYHCLPSKIIHKAILIVNKNKTIHRS